MYKQVLSKRMCFLAMKSVRTDYTTSVYIVDVKRNSTR